jgi:hypothetical protein
MIRDWAGANAPLGEMKIKVGSASLSLRTTDAGKRTKVALLKPMVKLFLSLYVSYRRTTIRRLDTG